MPGQISTPAMAESAAPAGDAPVITPEAVLAQLEQILLEVVGDDLLMDGPLTMETSFSDDLQLESIEFVALAEELLNTYGEKVDFVNWMSGMELDQVVNLTAGEVVGFVVASLEES